MQIETINRFCQICGSKKKLEYCLDDKYNLLCQECHKKRQQERIETLVKVLQTTNPTT